MLLPYSASHKPVCIHSKPGSSFSPHTMLAAARGVPTVRTGCCASSGEGRRLHLLAGEGRRPRLWASQWRVESLLAVAMDHHPKPHLPPVQEHISSRSIPIIISRLPLCFKKETPIPLLAMNKKRRLGSNKDSKGDPNISEPLRDLKETTKRTSRPTSSFLKKIPISHHKMEIVSQEQPFSSGLASSASTEHSPSSSSQRSVPLNNSGGLRKRKGSHGSWSSGQACKDTGIEKSEKSKVPKEDAAKQPRSKFVRRSPVPSTGKVTVKLVSDANKSRHISSAKHVDLKSSRPKSNFVKRSPIPFIPTSRLKTGSFIENTSEQDSQNILSGMQQKSNITRSGSKDSMISEAIWNLEQKVISGADCAADLYQCTLVQLRKIAKLQGVKGYSRLKKAELIHLLSELSSSGKNE